jgi:proline racemase
MLEVATVDYHTGGEPFRIVVRGAPSVPGSTVAERRVAAQGSDEIDLVRKLLCHEPRGHADMYGCFVVPPDDPGADLGVLFWHKDGYSTACGHGTIALAQWAVDSGRVAGPEVTIDVPSGRVAARISASGVTFRNVPSFVIARDVQGVDVAYGGAIYASVAASELGLAVEPGSLTELIAAGRSIKEALSGAEAARHPSDERLSGIYGTIIYEDLGDADGVVRQRNVTVFADGEVDRSPCGSGTSARLALLDADGRLSGGRVLMHSSIVGTEFVGRVVERVAEGVVTEVEGSAYRTGEHRFVLDPRDPVGTGFVLR